MTHYNVVRVRARLEGEGITVRITTQESGVRSDLDPVDLFIEHLATLPTIDGLPTLHMTEVEVLTRSGKSSLAVTPKRADPDGAILAALTAWGKSQDLLDLTTAEIMERVAEMRKEQEQGVME